MQVLAKRMISIMLCICIFVTTVFRPIQSRALVPALPALPAVGAATVKAISWSIAIANMAKALKELYEAGSAGIDFADKLIDFWEKHSDSDAYDEYVGTLSEKTVSPAQVGMTFSLKPQDSTYTYFDARVEAGHLRSYSATNSRLDFTLGEYQAKYQYGSTYYWAPFYSTGGSWNSLYSSEFTVPGDAEYTIAISPGLTDFPSSTGSISYWVERFVDGSWKTMFSSRTISGTSTSTPYHVRTSWPTSSTTTNLVGGVTYRIRVTLPSISCSSSGTGYYNGLSYGFEFPTATVQSSVQLTASPSYTRTADLFNAINEYNVKFNDYHVYLGTTDVNGDVTALYHPGLFSEQTLTFTEPMSGDQYLVTSWQYGYESGLRGYRLDLAEGTYSYNGTDIRGILLLYLEDALYIVGYDEFPSSYTTAAEALADATFVDKYAYVVAELDTSTEVPDTPSCDHAYTSQTITAPTCTEQGLRRYTCDLCGHTRDDKIPATGHAWEITESVETVLNDAGDVVSVGYDLYTCSGCQETYKQYKDTGQPGPPSGSDTPGGSGTSFWDTIKDAVSNAIGALVESVLNLVTTVLTGILSLATDFLSFIFDFLSENVMSGVRNFFTYFTDGSSIFDFWRKEDGTGVELPAGIATAFAFVSGVFLLFPLEVRSIFIFLIAALMLLGVLKLTKS